MEVLRDATKHCPNSDHACRHVPRPADLREIWSKPTSGPAEEALQVRLRSAVGEVVLAQ